jgi:YidC/Oxa1 family membrane protein insertase
MDRNAFLAFALSFAVLTLWIVFTTPQPRPEGTRPRGMEPGALAGGEHGPAGSPGAPPVVDLREGSEGAPEGGPEPEASVDSMRKGERIPLDTPLFLAELDTLGGVLRHFELKRYRIAPAFAAPPIVLTTGRPPYANALATPFRELGFGDLSRVEFAAGTSDANVVAFHWERDGVIVRKVYRFDPQSYAFELRLSVENGSQRSIGPRYGLSWPAHIVAGQDFREQAFTVLHKGSVVRKPLESFGRPGFFGGRPASEQVFGREVDWAGITTTYFLSAVLPDDPARASAQFVATDPGKAGVVQLFFDPLNLPPGQSAERVFRVYVGPKVAERLEAVGGGLVRSIDLGWSWLAPLTLAFSWLLRALHSLIPNYGVGIILLTVLVRAVTTPLTIKQMRSMERMRALQPKLQELREKYPDDRQRQSEEMMKLYRREGVNPLGGCLPMLLQLPVFIGLFYALRSSIDLRHAPFVGWIDDLSAPDALFVIPGVGIPLRVLPLVMGATMVLQQKITPMQVDPAQARMMMIVMPVMMTVLFYQFPSGLVLYWMVSNVLAIAHQLWVGRALRSRP